MRLAASRAVAPPFDLPSKSRRSRIRVYFSTNLDRPGKPCHRDGFGGCVLWTATVSLESGTPVVQSLSRVFGRAGRASRFPTVRVNPLTGRGLIAFNETALSGGTVADRNIVVLADLVGNGDRLGQGMGIVGARFPHLTKGKEAPGLAITFYEGDDVSNVWYAGLNGRKPTGWERVSHSAGTFEDAAEDGSVVPNQSHGKSLVYHQPGAAASNYMMLATRWLGPYRPHVAVPSADQRRCGHHGPTASGQWTACSIPDTTGMLAYPIRQRGKPRLAWLTGPPSGLLPPDAEDYPNGSGCKPLLTVHPSFGPTSSLVLFTGMCVVNDSVSRSTLYLAPVAPPAEASQVFDIGALIAEYARDTGVIGQNAVPDFYSGDWTWS